LAPAARQPRLPSTHQSRTTFTEQRTGFTHLARYFAGLLPLQLYELPFVLEPFELEITSVALRESDPALQW